MYATIYLPRFLVVLVVLLSTFSRAHAKYGGSGTADDPYRIATAADLILLGESPDDYDKHFILTADIDLDPNLPGRKVFDRAVIAADIDDTNGWFDGTPFSGVFDGNHHSIRHLIVTGSDRLALLGFVGGKDAMIRNVRLAHASVGGILADRVGTLVSELERGSLVNCHVEASTVAGQDCVGGLVGHSYGTIEGCTVDADVAGECQVGGMCGESKGTLQHCVAGGSVSGSSRVGGLVGESQSVTDSCFTGQVSGHSSVGGLVGYKHLTLCRCYAHAVVSGSENIGGLVGYHCCGTTGDCYARGYVSGDDAVGGLTGLFDPAIPAVAVSPRGDPDMFHPVIIRCYAVVAVVGQEDPGGLVGGLPRYWPRDSSEAEIHDSFWDIEASGQTASPYGSGLTTSEMQSAASFLAAGWDFVDETENGTDDIWWILEGQSYPHLWWEGVPVLVVDDFESYGEDLDELYIFQAWVDGWENGTGSTVGYEVDGGDTSCETTVVHGGLQSMPFLYDNDGTVLDGTALEKTGIPFYSECVRTWYRPQDWTTDDADTLTLHFRGEADNAPEPLYVAVEDSTGQIAVVTYPDADALLITEWRKWHISLADLRAAGVDVAAVKKMYIGVGDRDNPRPGGSGLIYIDDIWVTSRTPRRPRTLETARYPR